MSGNTYGGVLMKTVNKYKELLLQWFYYNESDNTVRRSKDGYRGKYKKGDIVKPYKLCSHGYNGVHIPTTRTTVPYHHLIYLLKGYDIPDNLVTDHIDGNTDNNLEGNIRFISQHLNCKNKRKLSNNTTGYTGISKCTKGIGYIVRKQISGKRVYLGYRSTLEEAVKLLESYSDILKADGYTERHGK